jgi:hypothetical protein
VAPQSPEIGKHVVGVAGDVAQLKQGLGDPAGIRSGDENSRLIGHGCHRKGLGARRQLDSVCQLPAGDEIMDGWIVGAGDEHAQVRSECGLAGSMPRVRSCCTSNSSAHTAPGGSGSLCSILTVALNIAFLPSRAPLHLGRSDGDRSSFDRQRWRRGLGVTVSRTSTPPFDRFSEQAYPKPYAFP